MLGLKENNIKFVPKRFWEYRGVLYSHLDKANKYGGYTAKNIGTDYFKPLVHTHSHKVGHVRVGDLDFYDNGCLCELEAEYLKGPSVWTQAFMVVDYIKDKPHFTQIQLKDHKYIWNEKLYTPNGKRSLRTKKKQK